MHQICHICQIITRECGPYLGGLIQSQAVESSREARLQPALRGHASPNTRLKCTLCSCHLHLCHSSKKTNCSGEVSE